MRLLKLYLVSILFLLPAFAYSADAKNSKPAIKKLGNEQYQIGNIHIDKKNKKFSVSGSIIRHEGPLEFLAVTKGGKKAYESLLELNVDAYEFNLACILIGLDSKNAKPSKVHFDNNPVEGDDVEINVSWNKGGKTFSRKGEDMLNVKKPNKSGRYWIYTGSIVVEGKQYMADVDGTLIGFSHDPSSIIEHHIGVGLHDYGAVAANMNLPPVGTKITLEVKAVKKTKAKGK